MNTGAIGRILAASLTGGRRDPMEDTAAHMRRLDVLAKRLKESWPMELQEFFDLIPIPIGVFNEERIIRVSLAWEHVLGWDRKELEGRRWIDFIHTEDRADTLKASKRMRDESLSHYRNRWRHRNGYWQVMEWYASRWNKGRSVAIGIARANDCLSCDIVHPSSTL